MKALALLLDDKHNPGSIRCAKDQLLKYLWRHLSFGVVLTANTSNVAVKELLQLAERLDPTYLSQHEADEVCVTPFTASANSQIEAGHVPSNIYQ
jgi:hypothetical protein